MSSDTSRITKASELTAANLRSVAKTISAQQLSRLTLPEIEAVVQLVSKIMPAGNVPGMILSGLARLPGRRIPAQKLLQDVTALFSGVEQILDSAVYGAFFAGPAAILWGYQHLLRLAGKDLDSAFPEGMWQFYADYALREDTARHTNETHGFDSLLAQHEIQLDEADRLTAWYLAAVTCLHQYPALLENEWVERMSISLMEKAMREAGIETQRPKRIFHEWELKRPYRREEDGAQYDYPAYRKRKFDEFLRSQFQTLPEKVYKSWQSLLQQKRSDDLSAYQRQMSILAYLEPGPYGETRVPFNLTDARVGVIHKSCYFLLPACEEDGSPIDVNKARSQIASLMSVPVNNSAHIASLAALRRSAFAGLRSKLNPMLVTELDNLKFAPVLISTEKRPRSAILSEIRQSERGIGSHALTIFDTGGSFVFDQSHIFFDGAWGTAFSEIMTNEALSWARYLNILPGNKAAGKQTFTALALQLTAEDRELIQNAPHVSPEAGAENEAVNLRAIFSLRKDFKQRNEVIDLTVNDLLVLYRAIHSAAYSPSVNLMAALEGLSAAQPDLASTLNQAISESGRTIPSILIPMDGSLKAPRDRVFPLNIEVPLMDLDLLSLHAQTINLLNAYESSNSNDRGVLFENFNRSQSAYLSALAGFGIYLKRAKEMAAEGETPTAGVMKLLAHLPTPIQRLLDKIPEHFEVLNNLIKGREVISNVGAVVPGSSLSRFMTAKDDNDQKQLAWGIITDSRSVMHIHLRDFRPHVPELTRLGMTALANQITQDYLDSYSEGFNRYIRELSRITTASRKTTALPRTKGLPN